MLRPTRIDGPVELLASKYVGSTGFPLTCRKMVMTLIEYRITPGRTISLGKNRGTRYEALRTG